MDTNDVSVSGSMAKPLECQVSFAGTLPAIPVALRRALLAEIPALAVSVVKIHHNDSAWSRLEVERRLRMLPIASAAAAQMRTVMRCVCLEGCGLCTVKLELDVTNTAPASSGEQRCVYAAEIVPGPEARAAGVGVADTGLDVSIVRLMPGQRIHCTCVVRKGYARIDAAFQVATAIGLAYQAEVIVDQERAAELSPAERRALAARCPKGVFDPDTLEPVRAELCDMCRACTDAGGDIEDLLGKATQTGSNPSSYHPLVHIARKTSAPTAGGQPRFPMTLTVKTTGSLPALEALLLAVSELKQRLARIGTAIEEDDAALVGQ